MTTTLEKRNGKWVVVPKSVKGQLPDKERFVALRSNRRTYEVFDAEQDAETYLTKTGGVIYRLTYYMHRGFETPMSNRWKEVSPER